MKKRFVLHLKNEQMRGYMTILWGNKLYITKKSVENLKLNLIKNLNCVMENQQHSHCCSTASAFLKRNLGPRLILQPKNLLILKKKHQIK